MRLRNGTNISNAQFVRFHLELFSGREQLRKYPRNSSRCELFLDSEFAMNAITKNVPFRVETTEGPKCSTYTMSDSYNLNQAEDRRSDLDPRRPRPKVLPSSTTTE